MAVVMTEVRRMWRELTSGIGLGDRVTARGNGVRCAADVTAPRVLWGRESSTSLVGGTASRCDTALWNGAVGLAPAAVPLWLGPSHLQWGRLAVAFSAHI